MPNVVSSILWAATRTEDRPLNIFCMTTHERFQSYLAILPHQFYAHRAPGLKDWNTKYAPLPNNYTLLPMNGDTSYIPADLDFDLILSQNKSTQFPIAHTFSQLCQIPLVSLEHTLPHPDWNSFHTGQYNRLRGHINVFLSEYSRKAWDWEGSYEIIEPGIDTNLFSPQPAFIRQPFILSIVNDWIRRNHYCGFELWKTITEGLPVKVLGDTPGLSEPTKDINELIVAYRQCGVFLNTSLVSTCPLTLLESMSCSCAVVSTATTIIPDIIQDGVNGFCSNDASVLRERCRQLLDNPQLCQKLGEEARRTVENRFSLRRMTSDWDRLLRKAVETHEYSF